MTVETFRLISYIGFGLAALSLVIAVMLFVSYNIPRVFGDVTGRTAKKEIENIRKLNEQSGDKAYKPSPINAARGKLTDKISDSGNLVKQSESPFGGSIGTDKLNTEMLLEKEPVTAGVTAVSKGNETEVLAQYSAETEVLASVSATNGVLTEQSGITTVLSQEELKTSVSVETDITFIHTDEVIE